MTRRPTECAVLPAPAPLKMPGGWGGVSVFWEGALTRLGSQPHFDLPIHGLRQRQAQLLGDEQPAGGLLDDPAADHSRRRQAERLLGRRLPAREVDRARLVTGPAMDLVKLLIGADLELIRSLDQLIGEVTNPVIAGVWVEPAVCCLPDGFLAFG